MLDLKPTTLCPALYKWSIKAAAMLRTQAAEIESLRKMLVISDDTHQTWMKANAPGGWIDDLRIERDALKQQAQIHAIEAAQAIVDYAETSPGKYSIAFDKKILILKQAIAQEQETNPLLPNCFNCKHSETPCNSATCRDCKHAYSSIDNWEPKP